jgi:hypothetical protein
VQALTAYGPDWRPVRWLASAAHAQGVQGAVLLAAISHQAWGLPHAAQAELADALYCPGFSGIRPAHVHLPLLAAGGGCPAKGRLLWPVRQTQAFGKSQCAGIGENHFRLACVRSTFLMKTVTVKQIFIQN